METTTILHESMKAVSELSLSDKYAIVSHIRKFQDNLDARTLTNICQYTFLNGYFYAEQGESVLTKEFFDMYNRNYTRIDGTKSYNHPKNQRNRFMDFIESRNIASEFFKKGMKLYYDRNH